ncbi:MAG: hypothetical protein KDA65_09745, partial [Planctomycetaceae bacterium]|nr:hypothetical protein [Planctomycetaceae bacterium]
MMKPPRRKWKRYVVLLFLPVVMSYGGLKIYQTRQQRQKFEAEFTQFEQGGGGWTRVSINGITPPHVRTRSFVNDVGTRVSTAFEDKYNLSGWLGKKWVDEIFYGEFNAVSLSSDAELEKLSHLVELSKITSIDLSSPKVTSKSFQLMLEKTPKVKLLKIRHAYLN